eukprot:TRINITY_DN13022_c0_g1_i11.p1 TRINITY_DN13022_c0_g1~~TRINITY_DN13022_c0_g1_i11.p1  ORF type:complete len:355 (-),score=66.87 TRINITY_DN13022_c0_g1_i11:236-1300(-)
MSKKSGSSSVMALYVQKALARNSDKAKESQVSKSELESRTSLKAKPGSRKCKSTETSVRQTKKEPETRSEQLNPKENLTSLSISFTDSFTPSKEIPNVECKLPRSELYDRASRRQMLNQAAVRITGRVVKEMGTISNPPQSVINVMIAYVCALRPLDEDKKIHARHKMYPNCTELLKNGEYMSRMTLKSVDYVDTAEEECRQKLHKIRDKYLIGWDMQPPLFSDKYSSPRLVLTYLLLLCSYDSNKFGLLHREFSAGRNKRVKECREIKEEGKRGCKELGGRMGRAYSEEKLGKTWNKLTAASGKKEDTRNKNLCITPPKPESSTTYNSTRAGLKKSKDDMIFGLLKVVNVVSV